MIVVVSNLIVLYILILRANFTSNTKVKHCTTMKIRLEYI